MGRSEVGRRLRSEPLSVVAVLLALLIIRGVGPALWPLPAGVSVLDPSSNPGFEVPSPPVPGTMGEALTEVSASSPGPEPASLSPYAVQTGLIAYVSGGAAMRNQGYGKLTLTWQGTLVSAFLIWGVMNDTAPTGATMNGAAIAGTLIGSNPTDPCWTSTIHTFVADVSAHVVNGQNVLSGFPSGLTTGENPWGPNPQSTP
ncbi:MAG: hypothetical protein ACREDF_05045, partial [Thermoplasmata archaeon]